MTTTPRHGYPELPSGQNASPETINEQLELVERGANLFPVLDILNATPGSPTNGQTWLVGTSPTGQWATDGAANKIASWLSGAWVYKTPKEGDYADVADEDTLYRYSGSAWAAFTVGGIPTEASASEIWAGSSTTKFLSPDKVFDAAAGVALTSSASITPNGNNGFNFTLLLGHTATLQNPSNFKEGQSGLIKITQDSGGPWTLAYGSNWKFPSGAPVLSTGAGDIDLLAYSVWPGGIITATLSKAYSS